jgi:hypothetical protein
LAHSTEKISLTAAQKISPNLPAEEKEKKRKK